MKKTQVQIPDDLYYEAKRIAKNKEVSFAEIVRQGLEQVTRAYRFSETDTDWSPPALPEEIFKKKITPKELKQAVDQETIDKIK